MSDAPRARPIRLASERTFAMVRVDQIDVMNPRTRGKVQFAANVRSIADNGLYKPILVNARGHAATGRYQLICGEGRLAAHRELKREQIKAEIIDVDLATAHLMALGENMTKCPPRAIEFAYALLDMHQKGSTLAELSRITGHTEPYVKQYINLVQRGEQRLITGVEKGLFTLEFAMKVAESPEGTIQHVLMDAYDKKIITARHVEPIRRILRLRARQSGSATASAPQHVSVDDLKKDIVRMTRERERFVVEAEVKETRVVQLTESLRRLREQPGFLALLERHGLSQMPQLAGSYAV